MAEHHDDAILRELAEIQTWITRLEVAIRSSPRPTADTESNAGG
jgi:hypothetical protein